MDYFGIYFQTLGIIIFLLTLLWLLSVAITNASIVDIFWGFGFVVAAACYYVFTDTQSIRKTLVMTLVSIWGLRLSVYLAWRNLGKGEDFRYQQFRQNYGPQRYWWFSFFQVFLLQGILLWIVSAPLLGAQLGESDPLGVWDFLGVVFWLIGFAFEAGGDFQLARFKANTANKGKVLRSGFWKYTRHPNYFGDSAVWWAYACFSIAHGSYYSVLGAVIMTALIIKVSGVSLLEKSLKQNKPEYNDYIQKTSTFIPWFPKK
ncbi:MAG: hypothetical protein RIS47_425 [Bacteroidota bacterium]|jgi:steroid 5-alpha reductase family enzyme